MRRPVVALLFAALAFVGALVGSALLATSLGAEAAAAPIGAGSLAAPASTHAGPQASSESKAKAKVEPFGLLVGVGAPLCDDRAASTYGAEPAPLPVDAGVLSKGDGKCATGALLAADVASSSSHDDLQRTPEPPVESVALPPSGLEGLPDRAAFAPAKFPRPVGDVVDDATAETDSPPPKPVPWVR